LVPRLKIDEVLDRTITKTWRDKAKRWWQEKILRKKEAFSKKSPLLAGDIIVKIAGTDNPTYAQMKDLTAEHEDKAMPITVLREGLVVEVEVTPLRQLTRKGDGPVTIGIYPILDIESPVVASTIAINDDIPGMKIPSGATITKINGAKIENYYQIAHALNAAKGKEVSIEYVSAKGKKSMVLTTAASTDDAIFAEAVLETSVPFASLREIYKADNPGQAVKMGVKKTKMFVVQTVITLKGLFTRSVSPTTLSGPLGIVTISYRIASKSTMYFIYFMGLISACIAVMNLLPLPVVDGGVIILLLIEKIKGSPISQKIQEIISYGGLAMILLLFAWLIWNDTLNMIFMPQ
jgi:regulator of sigma E protease